MRRGEREIEEVSHPGDGDDRHRMGHMLREPVRAEKRQEQMRHLTDREAERVPEGATLAVTERGLDRRQRRRPRREACGQAGDNEQADVHPRLAEGLLPAGDLAGDGLGAGHARVLARGETTL